MKYIVRLKTTERVFRNRKSMISYLNRYEKTVVSMTKIDNGGNSITVNYEPLITKNPH